MDKLQKLIDGYKTYITAAAILVTGILDEFGIQVPVYVWAALGAAGFTFLRAGVQKSKPGP